MRANNRATDVFNHQFDKYRTALGWLVLAYMLLLGVFACSDANADIDAGFAVVTNNYTGAVDPGYALQLRVGTKDQPVYLFGDYEETTYRNLGQPMAVGGVASFGIGAVKRWDKLEGFIEVGYAIPDLASKSLKIQNEMVYTQLVNNHEVTGRPLPAADPQNRWGKAETLYEIEGGYVGRVGVRYEVYPHVNLIASYRIMKLSEHMEWWDPERRAAGKGWWQESNNLDFNSAQIGIEFRY